MDFAGRFGNGVLLAPFLAIMRARARKAGVGSNEYVFGLNDTGHMTSDVVLALLRELPRGAHEMYFHPATDGPRAGELATLLDPAVARALDEAGIERIAFNALRIPAPR